MKFPHNIGKTPDFPSEFNEMASKKFDAEKFFDLAEKAGYAEARVHAAGKTLAYHHGREDRITAVLREDGFLKRYQNG